MKSHQAPLAERMRPLRLDEIAGQQHLLSPDASFRKSLENKQRHSLLLWGPPGVGKTTIAQLIADYWELPFQKISAVEAGVKDIRAAIESAEKNGAIVLFIDEIHRFNKAQQDRLLLAVESGVIYLVGATTENPSFEVISALLSRCQLYVLEELSAEELLAVVQRALTEDEILKQKKVLLSETDNLLLSTGGDARKLLNLLELLVLQSKAETIEITNDLVATIARNTARYDKNGEQHYDIISAYIKSIRGSDPHAALYWLARMLQAGENPKFIARRLLILASEDIGNANPNALLLANTCFEAVVKIGYPECDLILSQTTIYLATSAKSNASYVAMRKAQKMAKQTANLSVPLHLRNASSKLMKELGYGKGYVYPHNEKGNFTQQNYMPDALRGKRIYEPTENPQESRILQRLIAWWKGWY